LPACHRKIAEPSTIGLKDERYGEVVSALVRQEGDLAANEVREWVSEKRPYHLGMP